MGGFAAYRGSVKTTLSSFCLLPSSFCLLPSSFCLGRRCRSRRPESATQGAVSLLPRVATLGTTAKPQAQRKKTRRHRRQQDQLGWSSVGAGVPRMVRLPVVNTDPIGTASEGGRKSNFKPKGSTHTAYTSDRANPTPRHHPTTLGHAAKNKC